MAGGERESRQGRGRGVKRLGEWSELHRELQHSMSWQGPGPDAWPLQAPGVSGWKAGGWKLQWRGRARARVQIWVGGVGGLDGQGGVRRRVRVGSKSELEADARRGGAALGLNFQPGWEMAGRHRGRIQWIGPGGVNVGQSGMGGGHCSPSHLSCTRSRAVAPGHVRDGGTRGRRGGEVR
jgi:hypothetical protein